MIDPIEMLRKKVTEARWNGVNQSQMAEAIGVSPAFLSAVLHEKKAAGDKILEYLGLEAVRTVTYRPIQKKEKR